MITSVCKGHGSKNMVRVRVYEDSYTDDNDPGFADNG